MTALFAEDAGKFSFVLALSPHMSGTETFIALRTTRSTRTGRARMRVTSETVSADCVLVWHSSVDVPSGIDIPSCINELIEAFERDCEIVGVTKHTGFRKETRNETEEFRVSELRAMRKEEEE